MRTKTLLKKVWWDNGHWIPIGLTLFFVSYAFLLAINHGASQELVATTLISFSILLSLFALFSISDHVSSLLKTWDNFQIGILGVTTFIAITEIAGIGYSIIILFFLFTTWYQYARDKSAITLFALTVMLLVGEIMIVYFLLQQLVTSSNADTMNIFIIGIQGVFVGSTLFAALPYAYSLLSVLPNGDLSVTGNKSAIGEELDKFRSLVCVKQKTLIISLCLTGTSIIFGYFLISSGFSSYTIVIALTTLSYLLVQINFTKRTKSKS